MTSEFMHPSEFAYAFSYAGAKEIIGWDQNDFLPTAEDVTAPEGWLVLGETHLVEAGRLVGSAEQGLNFTDDLASNVLALVDPSLVLLAERKEVDGLRRLTVHAAGKHFVGLTRRADGRFETIAYSDITAAAGACAAFLGASLDPLNDEARIEAGFDAFSELRQSAEHGQIDKAVASLTALGASESDAMSSANALGAPKSSGMLSVLYCANNAVQDAQPYAVMTNSEDQTWVLFPPASLDAPLVLERSSVASLTARVSVEIAARLGKD
ncbi:MAG: hypothetical protein AB3N19_16470 [Ruegeria sp.]